MMAKFEKKKIENFDDENIADVRESIDADINSNKAYTKVQLNSPCEVIITKESRKKCVNLLLD